MHFKYQDAECPPVHGSPVAFALDDFRGQVLRCSTKGPRPGDREGHAQKLAVLGECMRLRRTESDNDASDHAEAPSPPRGPTVLGRNADIVSKDSFPYKRSLTQTEMKKSPRYHSRAPWLLLTTVTETQERHSTCFPIKRRGKNSRIHSLTPQEPTCLLHQGASSVLQRQCKAAANCPLHLLPKGMTCFQRFCGLVVTLISPVASRNP